MKHDVSPLLHYFGGCENDEDSRFGSDSTELKDHFIGISEHVSYALICKILS